MYSIIWEMLRLDLPTAGRNTALAHGSCSQGCHLASGLPRGASAVHAGIRKRILNLDLAPPCLAEARACSAESLAESVLPASLGWGLALPKTPRAAFPALGKKQPFGCFHPQQGVCALGRLGWVVAGVVSEGPAAEPPEHRGTLGA